jgi:hypothetical protein
MMATVAQTEAELLVDGLRVSAEILAQKAEEAEEAARIAREVYQPIKSAADTARYKSRTVESALEMWDNGGPLAWQTVAGLLRRKGYEMTNGLRDGVSFTAREGTAYSVQISVHSPSKYRPSYAAGKWDEGERKIWIDKTAEARAAVVSVLQEAGYACSPPSEEGVGPIFVRRGPDLAAESRTKKGITVDDLLRKTAQANA